MRGIHVQFGAVLSFCNFRVDLLVLASRLSNAFSAFWRDCWGSGLLCAL